MKYIQSDGTYINDSTITELPVGATLLSDTDWDNRLGAPDTTSVAIKQDIMWKRIQAVRDSKQIGGCKIVVNSVDKWYHTDQASRTQHLGLNMLGANIPVDLDWKTMDGTLVGMDQTIAADIFTSILTLDMTAFAAGEAHRAGMLAEADPYDYDYSTGWPQIYEDV